MQGLGIAGGLAMALLLVGCAGEQFAAPAPKPTPKIAMAGRWTLSEPGLPPCGMNFEGAPGSTQGDIHPEGGCPGDFFMSRSWQLDGGKLTIDDYRENALATLELARGGFKGKTTAGMPLSLAR
jgi:Protease inhibitor Inh